MGSKASATAIAFFPTALGYLTSCMSVSARTGIDIVSRTAGPIRIRTGFCVLRRYLRNIQPSASKNSFRNGSQFALRTKGGVTTSPRHRGLSIHIVARMNVDLAHTVADGFELIELKIESNTPYDAALQILRYGGIYMLYRLEPELASRFKSHPMMCAKRIVLEVLAPSPYYSCGEVDLPILETQLNREVETFGKSRAVGVTLSFRFMAFAQNFVFHPRMDCALIRNAVHHRASSFGAGTSGSGTRRRQTESRLINP